MLKQGDPININPYLYLIPDQAEWIDAVVVNVDTEEYVKCEYVFNGEVKEFSFLFEGWRYDKQVMVYG